MRPLCSRLTTGAAPRCLATAVAAVVALGSLALASACSSGTGNGLGIVPHDRDFKVTGSHQGFACDACHDPAARSFTIAGLPGDRTGMTCLGCHTQDVCSATHAAIPGYTWTDPSCVACHRDGTAAVSPADHAGFFPIAPGEAHAGQTCVSCHGSVSKATANLKCASCHTSADAWHAPPALATGYAAVTGYARDGASCYGCHKDSTVPTFTHLFAIASGSTHGPPMKCVECHGSTSPDPSQIACTTCHAHADQAATTTRHAGVTGFVYASQSCVGCHSDGASALPAGHDASSFPVTGTRHASVGCGSCHGADKTLASVTCVPCHVQATTAAAHAAIPTSTTGQRDGVSYPNYQYASPSCLRCHADGQVDRIASHPTVSGGVSGENHRPWCLTCHQASRSGGRTWGADFSRFTCLACHTSNTGGGG